MDPMDVLPPEVSLRVLGLLGPADLCRCLAVSSKWRQLADSDSLWRRVCQQRQLQHHTTTGVGSLPLCSWARTYIDYMCRLVKNWKSGSFESYQLVKEDWFCCIACCKSLVAVYYPRAAEVRLYRLDGGLVPVSTILVVALSGGTAIPDLFINEYHLVLCRGNSVLVYGNGGGGGSEGFGLLKSIVCTENGLRIADSPPPAQPSDRRLYVKIVTENVLWLESESIFVVDMTTDTYRVLGDTFRCLRFHGSRIFAANDAVTVFSLSGEMLFQLDIRGVVDMWVGEDLVAVLVDPEEQRLDVWRVSSRTLLHCRSVERDPTVCLGPDSLLVLEFGEGLLRLTSSSLESGIIQWTYENGFQRELLLHPEVRLLCERFVFIRPSHTKDENFLLIDAKTGKVLYDSVMPPSLSPPSYIYHLSDEMFITAESNLIHIRRYL